MLKLPNFKAKSCNEKIPKKEENKSNDNKILENIAKNVRTIRKLSNLTMYDLAEKSDLSANYIFSLEKNYQNISVTNLKDIAEALGVNMNMLLETDMDVCEKLFMISKALKMCSYEKVVKIEKYIDIISKK